MAMNSRSILLPDFGLVRKQLPLLSATREREWVSCFSPGILHLHSINFAICDVLYIYLKLGRWLVTLLLSFFITFSSLSLHLPRAVYPPLPQNE